MPRKKYSPSLKLDGNLTRKVVNRIEKWLPKAVICDEVGISVSTFDRWVALGSQGVKPYDDFHRKVSEAYSKRIGEGVAVIQESGASGYKWLLERMHPEDFGKGAMSLEVSHKSLPGEIIDVSEVEALTSEVTKALEGTIEKEEENAKEED